MSHVPSIIRSDSVFVPSFFSSTMSGPFHRQVAGCFLGSRRPRFFFHVAPQSQPRGARVSPPVGAGAHRRLSELHGDLCAGGPGTQRCAGKPKPFTRQPHQPHPEKEEKNTASPEKREEEPKGIVSTMNGCRIAALVSLYMVLGSAF